MDQNIKKLLQYDGNSNCFHGLINENNIPANLLDPQPNILSPSNSRKIVFNGTEIGPYIKKIKYKSFDTDISPSPAIVGSTALNSYNKEVWINETCKLNDTFNMVYVRIKPTANQLVKIQNYILNSNIVRNWYISRQYWYMANNKPFVNFKGMIVLSKLQREQSKEFNKAYLDLGPGIFNMTMERMEMDFGYALNHNKSVLTYPCLITVDSYLPLPSLHFTPLKLSQSNNIPSVRLPILQLMEIYSFNGIPDPDSVEYIDIVVYNEDYIFLRLIYNSKTNKRDITVHTILNAERKNSKPKGAPKALFDTNEKESDDTFLKPQIIPIEEQDIEDDDLNY